MFKIRIELKWALLFTLASLAWVYFEKTMGWHGELIDKHPIYTNIWGIIAILFYVVALIDQRNNFYKGRMTWQQGFKCGVFMTMIIAAFVPLVQYVAHEIISPAYFENAIAHAVESGNATREEAETFFNLKSYILQSVVFALVAGFVTAALVALAVRRR